MKIIGVTQNGRVLVDASMDEMAQLTGYRSNYYRERDGKRSIGSGHEIDVKSVFEHMEGMKRIGERLVQARGLVDPVSASIMLADNLIKAAVEFASNSEPAAKE